MLIALTGSSGLLGRAIAEALIAAGHKVRGIDAVPPTAALTSHLHVPLEDFGAAVQALAGTDAVIHAAAIPRPTGRVASDVFRINMALTFNVIEAAALLGIRRVVYASSFSVLGFPFFEQPVELAFLPIDETHPLAPQDAYALTKALGEDVVEAAVRRGRIDAISLRMPWIQSPATFLKEVGPRRASAESGRDLWSYIDARDAAAGFLAALEATTTGHQRFFLSAADTYSETPTADLVRSAFPSVRLRQPLEGHRSVIDTAAARAALGFVARHSWRDY